MDNMDIFFKRKSIRKFTDAGVPKEDIVKIIEAGTAAPSGKNLQNWHFTVVTDREKIEKIARIIEKKNEEIAKGIKDEKMAVKWKAFLPYAVHFRHAPVLILVAAGPYPATGLKELKAGGAASETIHRLLRASPGIQNIGAAIQNILLAASEMGYGTCWMTSQNYADPEIEEFLGTVPEGYHLAAITPLGVPAEEGRSPARKPIGEVLTFVE